MKKLTVEDILYFEDEVIKWNALFGNDVNDKSLIPTYHSLSKEEWFGKGEYLDSYNSGDIEGRLDGLIDSIFVGFYWAALEGFSLQKEKTFLSDLVVGKAIDDTTEDLVILVGESLIYSQIYDYQTYLLCLLYKEQQHFDIRSGFDRVLRSNYSKAAHVNDGLNVQEEIASIEAQGRYGDVFAQYVGDHIIFRAKKDLQEGVVYEKGKVVKPHTFKSVEDLGGLKEFIY